MSVIASEDIVEEVLANVSIKCLKINGISTPITLAAHNKVNDVTTRSLILKEPGLEELGHKCDHNVVIISLLVFLSELLECFDDGAIVVDDDELEE